MKGTNNNHIRPSQTLIMQMLLNLLYWCEGQLKGLDKLVVASQ